LKPDKTCDPFLAEKFLRKFRRFPCAARIVLPSEGHISAENNEEQSHNEC
jgi:hypothetical protein